MSIPISADQVRRLRLRAQMLDGDQPVSSPAAVVRAVGGVQAQEAPSAGLAIRARSTQLTVGDVERARAEERTIVRTWAMRGTLHLLPSEDVRWLLALLGPVFIRANARRRADLGLDDGTCERGAAAIAEILSGRGPLTRSQLVRALDEHGIHLEGQARPYLIAYAALRGLVCISAERGSEAAYVLLNEWLPPAPVLPPESALNTLARRYLDAYGPAGPADFAAWSGLPAADVRSAWEAIEPESIELDLHGETLRLLAAHCGRLDATDGRAPSRASVRLLGRYDTFLLGYRRRDLAVAPVHAARINAGGGIVQPVLLVDGIASGTWTMARRRDALEIAVTPFEPLDRTVLAGMEQEVADIGRYLGLPAVSKLR